MIFCQTILFLGLVLGPNTGAGEYELWKTGREYWFKDQWQQAADTYSELIEKYPQSPRRCKSENYLGYCYYKMGDKAKAFEVFSRIAENRNCKEETILDAKSERLQIAYELTSSNPDMKAVLLESLSDRNPDIRLMAAVWLSELNDNSGIEIFFNILKYEDDVDRRDTAAKHIIKIGSKLDKDRLDKILAEMETSSEPAKMVRLIIRDLETNKVTVKLNVPISLINVIIQSLNAEQLDLIKNDLNIDLRDPNLNLEKMPRGQTLLKIVDGKRQEIKVFLE